MNAKLAAWRLSLLNLHVQLHVGLHAQTTQLAFNPHVAIELNLRDVRVELRTSRRSCITSQNDYHYTTVQLTVVTATSQLYLPEKKTARRN